MKKSAIPTTTQAKLLARLWGFDCGLPRAMPKMSVTMLVCTKQGWTVLRKGRDGEYATYEITVAGIDAIEDYLRISRYERVMAEREKK